MNPNKIIPTQSTVTPTKYGNKKKASPGNQKRVRHIATNRQKILEATEKILITSGYRSLSMRNVASECDISLGNLTYHFKTKESLIIAVIERMIDFYLEGFRRLLSDKDIQADTGIEKLMAWLLQDASDIQTAKLNRELWMLSSHYPEIQKRISNLYHKLITDLVGHLAQKYPHLSQTKLNILSCLIAILTEGTCVVYGGRYRTPVELEEIKATIIETITQYTEI